MYNMYNIRATIKNILVKNKFKYLYFSMYRQY